VNASQSSLLKL